MSIEARNRLLPDWFTRVRTHQTVLPRFQRFEAWDSANVVQMFNTILRDLPVGAVLILEIGNEEPFISRTIRGAPERGERVTEHLLDGQQRLTALWRGLHNNYEDRTYFVFFEADEETGMPYYVDSLARWQKEIDTERRPFWANKPSELWKRRMVPLDLFAPDVGGQRRFKDWARSAIVDEEERDEIGEVVSEIRQKFATFNLPFMSLPVATKPETALDVFVKMNTSAAPLSVYDIVVAQVEAGLGTSLHDLVAEIRSTVPSIEAYYPPEELCLYVSALLQGRSPTNASYRAKDFGPQMLSNWNKVVHGVSRVVTFLEEERIFDAKRMPTDVVIPMLAALWAVAPMALDGEGRARTILRRFLWRSFFSNRYENSTSTRALADFRQLEPLMIGGQTTSPEVFDDARHPLPDIQEFLTAGWPATKERLSRALLCLALRHGGHDLADGSPVSRANIVRREYHHLFPEAYLTREGEKDERIYLSLNCALITWQTNRSISDKKPERYIAERTDKAQLGLTGSISAQDIVRARLATHLIPFDEMVAGDYHAFLARRAAMMHDAMLALCIKGQA